MTDNSEIINKFIEWKDLAQNPDILAEIFQNYDYLSVQGRIDIVNTLKHILKRDDIPDEMQDIILKDTMKSIAEKYRQMYSITILRDSDISDSIGTYDYEFSVLYRKSDPYPTISIEILIDILAGDYTILSLSDILSNGWIWSFNGISGRAISSNIKFYVYSDGIDRMQVRYETPNDPPHIKEFWLKDGIRDHPKFPADVRINDDGSRIAQWMRKDINYRENNKPDKVSYSSSGNIIWEKWSQNIYDEDIPDNLPTSIGYYDIPGKYASRKIWHYNYLRPKIIKYDRNGNILPKYFRNNTML